MNCVKFFRHRNLKKSFVPSAVFLLAGISILASQRANATPAEVLIIRHAEKDRSGNELSEKGFQRANALPRLFQDRADFVAYGKPAALFGFSPRKANGSIRGIQTLIPLSKVLGEEVRSQFRADQIEELVQAVLADRSLDGKTVMICWNREGLQEIAQNFGVANAPVWDSNTFDRIWRINFPTNGDNSFVDFPERLLPGDSER